MKKGLSRRQMVFIDEYLKDLNAEQAAIRAGYARSTARKESGLWLGKSRQKSKYPAMWDAVQAAMDARSQRTQIDSDYVLNTIQDTVEKCRQVVPVLDHEGKETGEYRFEANAVLKGCELLGRHLKLFTDKVEVTAKKSFAEWAEEIAQK